VIAVLKFLEADAKSTSVVTFPTSLEDFLGHAIHQQRPEVGLPGRKCTVVDIAPSVGPAESKTVASSYSTHGIMPAARSNEIDTPYHMPYRTDHEQPVQRAPDRRASAAAV
jgi:hypothetical protein